jgi:hypothetical protein
VIEVTGIVCPACKAFVFSRARHDFRGCSCGACHVDGGFDYLKVGWDPKQVGMPVQETREFAVTRDQLFRDWNSKVDTWGVVPGPTLVEDLAAALDEEAP